MKKFTALSVITLLIAALLPTTAFAGYDSSVRSGYTATFDSVYYHGDKSSDETAEAKYDDNQYLELFDYENRDQYLYMGMNSKFDKVMFDVERVAYRHNSYADNCGYYSDALCDPRLSWEYWDGNSWEDLRLKTGGELTAVTEFNVPSNWSKNSINAKTMYWVRITPYGYAAMPALVDRISARAYNLKLTIKDDRNRAITNLTVSDFRVSEGSDNNIYAMRNLGSGVYEFAIRANYGDNNFKITIRDSRYDTKSFNVSNLGTSQRSYKVTLEDDEPNYRPYNDYYDDRYYDNNRYDDRYYDNNRYDDRYYDDPYYPTLNPPVILSGDFPFSDLYAHWAREEVRELYDRGVVTGRSYYSFSPNTNVTRAEFLKMALLNAGVNVSSYNYSEPFWDVSSRDWFQDYVAAAYELDVIGFSQSFRPNDPIDRAEAVTMLVRLAGIPAYSSNTHYTDVFTNHWFAKYIRVANKYGVVEGYRDGTFRPGNNLSRGEAAVMVSNAYHAWRNY